MLVLTRTVGDSIIIEYKKNNKIEKIIVTTLDIKNTKVKIGIEAPKKITVCREEIYKSTTPRPQGKILIA